MCYGLIYCRNGCRRKKGEQCRVIPFQLPFQYNQCIKAQGEENNKFPAIWRRRFLCFDFWIQISRRRWKKIGWIAINKIFIPFSEDANIIQLISLYLCSASFEIIKKPVRVFLEFYLSKSNDELKYFRSEKKFMNKFFEMNKSTLTSQ